MKSKLKLITASIYLALVAACGGSGSSSSDPVTSTGIFLDSAVHGIKYRTKTKSGKTNANGEFSYVAGETVTFSIGNIDLPAVTAGSTITPLQIASTTDVSNQKVANILVLLQTLDSDGDPSNGIQIADAAHTAHSTATSSAISFDVPAATFQSDTRWTNHIASSGTLNSSPVSVDKATSHFQTTLATVSSGISYSTPKNFTSILNEAFSPSSALVTSSSFSNLNRFLLASGSASSIAYLSIGSGSNPTYTVESSTLGNSTTYNDYFIKGLQAVVDSSDTSCFRLDSELHSIYSLDVDLADVKKLKFRNNWGAATTGYGYLCFSYDNTTGRLQAKKRYTYSTANYTHTLDSNFPGTNTYYVNHTSGVYSLVTTTASATAFSLYQFPINVAIPTAFNPSGISAVSNARLSISSVVTDIISQMIGATGSFFRDLIPSSVQTQVAAAGSDASSTIVAEAKLTEIKTTAQANNFKLRYDVEVYKAFRNALLNTKTTAEGVVNGALGMSSAPFVYFTNEKDSSNVYHPFMVIASYSIADRPSRLLDVIRPPGEGGVDYPSARVTRDSEAGLFLFKIPMKDYGLVSQLSENTMLKSLGTDSSTPSVTADVYNYASISTSGVAIDGMEIYPTYNNVLIPSQAAGELTSNGNHVGQGRGIHYHADSQSGVGNELALYNLRDYVGKTHPPLIGFGLDGVALFGRYVSNYSSMKGYTTTLDDFGGHDHDGIGYHYHAHTTNATTSDNKTYVLSVLMKGAWKGKINSIPEFWDTTKNAPAVSMSQRHKYVGRQSPP